jgi:fatty acid desaturase
LFRTRWANRWAGRLAGFWALIPFHVWARVHGRHHKWTGWQDVDPTTATLVRRDLARWERLLVNVCWRFWIPIFAVLYRLNNFWHVPRIWRLFPPGERGALVASALGLSAVYLGVAIAVGPLALFRVVGLALVLAFIVQDVLLISQHTHIPMTLSRGEAVAPYPARDQERFTRSLRLPAVWSWVALHFDAHELHHMFPAVPGYRLGAIGYVPAHEVPVSRWVPAARAVRGDVLLFQSRNESGFDV